MVCHVTDSSSSVEEQIQRTARPPPTTLLKAFTSRKKNQTHTHTHTHRQTLDWRLIHGWDLTVELQRGYGIWLVYIARS
ncbi:hypothetical protein ACSBR2_030347 [Camellia fascicularis]